MLLNGVVGRGVPSSCGGGGAGGKTSLHEHRLTLLVSFALLTYFLWMDVALYHRIQSLKLVGPTPEPPGHFSPFRGLSVKMMMLDHVNNYVAVPLANLFDRVTRFTEVFYFVTPNMISVVGVVCAMAAAKLVTSESLAVRQLGVLFMSLRTFLDSLDGQVARSRMGIVRLMSVRQTSGYVVDGVADTIGFAVFLAGCFVHLRRRLLASKLYLPMVHAADSGDKTSANGGSTFSVAPHPVKKIMVVVLCLGVQMAVSCFFWDRYINEYHVLLELPGSRKEVAQTEVLRSSMMWIIMWFWRISNAHALMQMLLFAIFINRMWEFLVWIQYIGFAVLGTLVLFTEFHLRTVRSYLL